MKRLRPVFLFMIVITCLTSADAVTDLQLGARAQGMGGAYTALASDANAVYWNPSGLSLITRGEATFMHWTFNEVSQISVDYLSLAYPLSRGAVGFSWIRQGAELEQGSLGTKSTISENSFLLSFGLPLDSRMSIGLSLNRLVINSLRGGGAGISFEFGGLYQLIKNRWTIAATGKNVVANMKNESLNPFYFIGTAYRFASKNQKHRFAIAFDISTRKDIDGKEGVTLKYAGGIEYLFKINHLTIALRTGLGSKNYCYGFGLCLSSFSIDYAYVQMRKNTIGNSQKFGISFRFGGGTDNQSVKTENVVSTINSPKKLNLSGKMKKNMIQLKWSKIPDCDGYQVLFRVTGKKWQPAHKNLLKRTKMRISNRRNHRDLEFLVKAFAKGEIISESDVLKINKSK